MGCILVVYSYSFLTALVLSLVLSTYGVVSVVSCPIALVLVLVLCSLGAFTVSRLVATGGLGVSDSFIDMTWLTANPSIRFVCVI